MTWLIIIAIIVILIKNQDKIFSLIKRFQSRGNGGYQQSQAFHPTSASLGTNNFTLAPLSTNANHPNLTNSLFIKEAAASIAKYSEPFVNYLRSNYPATDKTLYGFFPLVFIADILDKYSIGNNTSFVYSLESEVEKLEDYSELTSHSSSYNDCYPLQMMWNDAIWKNYLEYKAAEKEDREAIMQLFIRNISVTAVSSTQTEIDKNMCKMAGAALRDFGAEIGSIWYKYKLQ